MRLPTTLASLAFLSSASDFLLPLRPDEPHSVCEAVFPGSQNICCDHIHENFPCLTERVSNVTDCGLVNGIHSPGWSCCVEAVSSLSGCIDPGDLQKTSSLVVTNGCAHPMGFLDEGRVVSVNKTVFTGTVGWTMKAMSALNDCRSGVGPWISHKEGGYESVEE
jgi:hypothetical protein